MKHTQMILHEAITNNRLLYIAFELSETKWKLMFSNGVKRRQRTIESRDLNRLLLEIRQTQEKFQMGEEVTMMSCYEAGRDGFWLHRFLTGRGINNLVVDSASIEVNRRQRRAKTDRVDAEKLLNMLVRHVHGERKHWSVVRVPEEAAEDARRLSRELERLKKERTAHTNRIKSLLVLHGVTGVMISSSFQGQLEGVRLWDGKLMPEQLKQELLREYERYCLIQTQIRQLTLQQREQLKTDCAQAVQVRTLGRLRGIGPVGSWKLVYEFFSWRRFANGKQVGAAAGLTPTPYASGTMNRELGISKAGNRRIRHVMIEMAWQWVRWQPDSELSKWFEQRFGSGTARMRKTGIVAVARKLLIALWKYLEQGCVPEGALVMGKA